MEHGGDISRASEIFGNGGEAWLDLSTGIAPHPYPIPPIPHHAWQSLPQMSAMDALATSARSAYRVPANASLVAAPGTQLLIQLLPLLFGDVKQVRILGPTYSEHSLCWQRSVPDTKTVADIEAVADAGVAVIANPNNPDGRIVSPADLLDLARHCSHHGQLLIVDEAFGDVVPDISMVPHSGDPGLIILRSFGKFYGLAGLRLGFAIGAAEIVQRLATALGPWAVSGPACHIASQALRDDLWADEARADYRQQAAKLDRLLIDGGLKVVGGTSLFRLVHHDKAAALHKALASQGIWSRKFDHDPCWLRFGLPGQAANFARLEAALAQAHHAL